MMNARALADKLGGEVSGGAILAPGPGHSDQDRSLSIKLDRAAPDGFIIYSFSNDDPIKCRDHVRSKAGLPAWGPQQKSGDDIVHRIHERGIKSRVVAEYVYHDYKGQPSRKVARTTDKQFPQYHWTGSGWRPGVKGLPVYPYRLPDMLKAIHDTVFIAEGEKDADRLASLGYVSTTNPGGAGSWNSDLNKWFAGKRVYLFEDNDDAGRTRVQKIAREIHPVAECVRIVTFRDLPEKADVSDWLDANPSKHGLLIEEWETLPTWSPDTATDKAVKPDASLSTIRADDLQAMTFQPVKYVVPGYIVEGLTLFAGRPKIGKSWLALDIAAAIARGGVVLGDIKCAEGDVLYAALEDTPRRLQSRMNKIMQLQPWPKRLEFATDMPRLNEGGLDKLRSWISRAESPRLIIVDTLQKVRAVKKSGEEPYAADYAAVTGLKALADGTGVAIVLIHHVRKMEADDPIDTVSGTTGLTGGVDSILILNRTSQGVTLYGRGRDIEEIEKAAEFNRNACRWTIKGDAQDVQRSDARNEILAVLKDSDDAMTAREVHDLSHDLTYENVRKLLRRMVATGEVNKEGRGRYRAGVPMSQVSQRSQDDE